MHAENFCIGIDFGTDSVRSMIVDAKNGRQAAFSEYQYPRWANGLYCIPHQHIFRQHPLDYLEGLEHTLTQCLREAGPAVRSAIRAISVDTTGSTPVAVNEAGVPLALLPSFQRDPDAMFILWKDHSAMEEAAAINDHARKMEVNYLRYVGGVYSSEWFWSKLLSVLRKNNEVANAAYSWVEHCDWIPFLLTGGQRVADMKRGVCAAGHKALWSTDWKGLPPNAFFATLDPLLDGLVDRLYTKTHTADQVAGRLCPEWAEKLGLSPEVIIGVGALDAHMGAVGGQIEPYMLSKVMGTSTCDMLVAPMGEMEGKYVPGICGLVNGSIIPGMIGMEAGQSAFGDVYAWFKGLLAWPLRKLLDQGPLRDYISNSLIPELSKEAAQLEVELGSELSVDWFNGRRTPDANASLKGSITGLNLGSSAPAIFRSLVEATCFGSRAIVERFNEQQIPVKGLIGIGGVARKSPFIMQMLADVLNMPIRINKSEQTCALGAAMFAATVAGMYPKIEDAMQAMGWGFDVSFYPDAAKTGLYTERYARYLATGNYIENQRA